MESRTITIPVVLGEKSFRRFALYDALIVQRRWRRPAAFSGILLAFAVAALLTRREQSGLIPAGLLTVGSGLPLVWIGAFLSQINLQVIRNRLKPPRAVYRVLSGFSLANDSTFVPSNIFSDLHFGTIQWAG